MTQVTVYVTRRGRITGYAAIGHTESANAGEDIVCAGVSTITQSTVNALAGVAHVPPRVVRRPGLLLVRVNKAAGMRWHDAQIILRACALSLAQLAEQYPRHVRIIRRLDESAA